MSDEHFTFSKLIAGLAVIALLAGTAFAQAPASPARLNKAYPLIIDGTATLVGKWACGGDARVEAKPEPSAEPVPGLLEGLQMITVIAYVPNIECGDSTMNKHLRKALKVDAYPEIRYRAGKYTLVDNGTAVQSSGELTIAGVTKPVGLGAKLIPLPEGGAKVEGAMEIDMTDYGVKPPSVLFGALKVARIVTVRFDTVVRLPHEMTQALFPGLQ
jgi:hypothetical protein